MQTPDAKDISKSAESWLTAERLTDLGCIQRQRYERVSIHTQEQRWCRYNLLREFPTFWRKVCHVFLSSASSFLRMRLIVKISESQCCWEVGVWLRRVFLWARGTSAKWTEAPSVKAGQTYSLGTVWSIWLEDGRACPFTGQEDANANASEPEVQRVASHPVEGYLRRRSVGFLPGCGVGSLNGLTFSESGCKAS